MHPSGSINVIMDPGQMTSNGSPELMNRLNSVYIALLTMARVIVVIPLKLVACQKKGAVSKTVPK
jgi:hypothetical protein